MLCLYLGSALCVPISSSSAQERKTDRCAEYFQEILEIHKFQEMLRIGAEEITERYNRGELTKEELDTTLTIWHNTESKLQQRVSKIYEVARSEKCFEEKK